MKQINNINEHALIGYIVHYKELLGLIHMCKYHLWKKQLNSIMLQIIKCCENKEDEMPDYKFFQKITDRKSVFQTSIRYSEQRLRKLNKECKQLLIDELEITLDAED